MTVLKGYKDRQGVAHPFGSPQGEQLATVNDLNSLKSRVEVVETGLINVLASVSNKVTFMDKDAVCTIYGVEGIHINFDKGDVHILDEKGLPSTVIDFMDYAILVCVDHDNYPVVFNPKINDRQLIGITGKRIDSDGSGIIRGCSILFTKTKEGEIFATLINATRI